MHVSIKYKCILSISVNEMAFYELNFVTVRYMTWRTALNCKYTTHKYLKRVAHTRTEHIYRGYRI